MKKTLVLLVLFLALAMILALAACGAAGKGDPTLVRGTVDGLNYQNESLGLGCTLEGDWHVFSDEELAEMSGTTAEIFNDPEKYQKLLESSNVIQDFNATHTSGANINIVFERLNAIGNALLSEEQYQELAVTTLEKTFSDMAGVSDVTVEKQIYSIAGTPHPGTLTVAATANGNYYSQQVYIKTGKHMAVITLSSFFEEDPPFMLGFFYGLEK